MSGLGPGPITPEYKLIQKKKKDEFTTMEKYVEGLPICYDKDLHN